MSLPDYLPFGKPSFSELEIEAVTRVLRSGWIGMGPETLAFEHELAAFLGTAEVVTVDSCTSALFLALRVQGIGPGDEVIVPSLTWCATANAAVYLGATPVFADVDPDTLCVTPATISACLTPRTRAVLPVHFGGYAVDLIGIRAVLPEGVILVEDAAHALGSTYPDGGRVGTSGNLVCFSFYANKNLSTGEGGAIALADRTTADRLRSLRQNGMPANAWNRFSQPKAILYAQIEELGYKMNYTDLHAAIGRVQLRRQAAFETLRIAIAQLYSSALLKLDSDIHVQSGAGAPGHSLHLFVVRLPIRKLRIDRDTFVLALREHNIGASIHYPPLHLMKHFQAYGRSAALPATEHLSRSILTLPISASMSLADAEGVMIAFEQVYRRTLKEGAS